MIKVTTFITAFGWMVFPAIATDSVTLKSGNIISGDLIDSETSGILTLTHPSAAEPIKIKESAIERIIFDSTENKDTILTESIKLINGDHFPCKITELTDKAISFESDTVGNHTVARDKVSQIKFNTKANKTLYQGPGDDLRKWTTTTDDWKLNSGKLSTFDRSDAAILIPNLEENYIFEFKTAWDENSPHLRVCFSSNTALADRNSDYYYIDLNSNGISIYRSNKGKYTTFTQMLKIDEIYAQPTLHIAIRLDRKNQKMALYINGKLTNTISDPQPAPKGSYLIIKSLQRSGVLTEVSEIKVSSWGGKVIEDFESKAESLTNHDLITDLKGSIMTGQILNLSREEDKAILKFKAPFAKTDSTIQSNEIDLLEFKSTQDVAIANKAAYHLNLNSGGLISFSSSQMLNGNLTIEHPFLGKVSIPKASLASVIIAPTSSKVTEPK